jgi:hypothetical protein
MTTVDAARSALTAALRAYQAAGETETLRRTGTEAAALRAAITHAFEAADSELRDLAATHQTAADEDLPAIESEGQAAEDLRRIALAAAKSQTPPLDLFGYGHGFWARRQTARAEHLRRFVVRGGQFVNHGPSARERRADEDFAHDTDPSTPHWAG